MKKVRLLRYTKKAPIVTAIQFVDDSSETLSEINKLVDPLRVSYRSSEPVIIINSKFNNEVICAIGDYIVLEGSDFYVYSSISFQQTFQEL